MRRRRRAACLTATLLLAVPAAAHEASAGTLAPGMPVERPLSAGAADVFLAELEAGKPWRVRVEQLGIDVVVEVKELLGGSLLTVGNPLGREGTESLLLTPTRTGTYHIEIRCEEKGVPDGRYILRLDELPDTTPEDRMRLRAEKALSDAGRLQAAKEDGAGKKALARLGEALDAWTALGDRHEEARTFFLIGRYFDALNDYRDAATSYDQALALWRRLEDPAGVASTLDGLGLAHENLGEFPRAVGYLEESLVLRRRLGSREREAATLNLLGLALLRSGRFRDAAGRYEETLALARDLGDTDLEARVLNSLGGIFQNLGEPAREQECYLQALELQRKIGGEVTEGVVLNNLGALHRRLGDVETALQSYAQALAIFERLGHRYLQARTLNNIGFAYLSLGELERAQAYLLRALPLRREVGDKAGESVTLLNLGRTSAGLGEDGKALAYFKKALKISLEAGNRRSATTARQRIGELYLHQDEAEAARAELEAALASLRETGQRLPEAEVMELLSRVHLALGDLQKAETLAAEALDLHRTVKNPLGEVAARTTLARVQSTLGRPGAGRGQLEAALEVLETLQEQLGDPGQHAAFQASQREVYELYVELLMQLHRQSPAAGYDLEALAASERGRSRSLLGLLERVGAGLGRDVEPALRERLRAAEQRFTAKTQRQLDVLGQRHGAEEALLAGQELYTALNDLDNVRAEIRRRSPRYASLRRSETLDAAAVRALLDDGTVLLEYLLGEERTFLWWVTRDSVSTYELPPRREVEALTVQVYEELSAVHQRTGTAREGLRALGQTLLGPVAERLRDQRLVIVADGALHFVPFAALTLPRPDGAPVLARHEVVYLPSASVLAIRREMAVPTVSPTKTVAIFADPIYDRRDPRLETPEAGDAVLQDVARWGSDDLVRLTHTRREAEAIAALVPSDQRLLALDGDARRSRVVDDELAAYRILHFATHGLIDSRTPELSGLVLSRFDADGKELDGFLGLYDVSNLGLSAELVVLSGCRTALGKQVRGEGLVGLTRGFMYAGVPRVVSSFWQVRDQATAELMTRFYRALLSEDLTPAAALRAAQLALREERRFRDPFYWAAFALQGDWR